ncbi:MAG: helix-turn-helix transcriptional regulator [Thermoplasmata archaeon]|nr:helix-turn-helix transcriptional regulator [Thermoplasmata archaeon]
MTKPVGGLHVLTDPVAIAILLELGKSRSPANVSQLVGELDRPRTTVAYHLGLLEKFKILRSKYKISHGRAYKMYSIDKKVLKQYLKETDRLFELVE